MEGLHKVRRRRLNKLSKAKKICRAFEYATLRKNKSTSRHPPRPPSTTMGPFPESLYVTKKPSLNIDGHSSIVPQFVLSSLCVSTQLTYPFRCSRPGKRNRVRSQFSHDRYSPNVEYHPSFAVTTPCSTCILSLYQLSNTIHRKSARRYLNTSPASFCDTKANASRCHS